MAHQPDKRHWCSAMTARSPHDRGRRGSPLTLPSSACGTSPAHCPQATTAASRPAGAAVYIACPRPNDGGRSASKALAARPRGSSTTSTPPTSIRPSQRSAPYPILFKFRAAAHTARGVYDTTPDGAAKGG